MSRTESRTEDLSRLPVRAALPALRRALDERGMAVLQAPPGTGKTTLVPLALAGLLDDGQQPARRVLVAEPRRLAARSAARRMAYLLGEEVGESVGYTVRGERRAGPRTRVEVVTTGILLRRLQRDQELPGVDVVLLDECHERHLDADTALAFLVDVRGALRPDLRLVVASATADTEAWARLLSVHDDQIPAPVVSADGTSYPVTVRYVPPPRTVRPPHGTRVDPALLRHVAQTVRNAVDEEQAGDVLCFLPGVGEIARVAAQLAESLGPGVEVMQLHGRAPASVQEAVLRGRTDDSSCPAEGVVRRVILTTSVAESSLTVPGVRVVIDSGLAREPRMDHARGLGSLATVRVSQATAEQRAGRAGREAPGVALRCWDEAENARQQRFPSPEIALADLTDFALHCAGWGDPQARSLALLDPPPAGALAAAQQALRTIGALETEGRVTPTGAAMAEFGLHPRLARALLEGARLTSPVLAAEVVSLLSEEPPREFGREVVLALRAARSASASHPYGARWRREVRRLRNALRNVPTDRLPDGGAPGPRELTEELAVGLVVALAAPERVAARRGESSYLMASGTRAECDAHGAPWLAVAVADRPAGAASARVRLAAELDEEAALLAAGTLRREFTEVRLEGLGEQVVARRVSALGAIELSSRPVARPEPAAVREAKLAALREHGLGLLRWSADAVRLRQRLAFLHRAVGTPWPAVDDDTLLPLVAEQLTGTFRQVDTLALLNSLLPWASGAAAELDTLAPERVEVPSGSRVRIDYEGDQPVLAVKVQELFGWNASPRIAGGRVPLLLHLLSPAGRPAAVTADLASFWQQGYHAVRAELRGRYPRHPWPQDPLTAKATRRAQPRR